MTTSLDPGPDLVVLDGVRWRGLPVPGDRAQALLGALVLAAPRTVPVGDLVEAVWPDAMPDHPEKALQVQVSRLRARTGAEVVARVGAGYRLALRDDQVDALVLRRLLDTAREGLAAGDQDVVRHAAGRALDVPVGPSLDGPTGDLVRRAVAERGAARRLLGSVLLGRGEHAEALALLEPALGEDPGDETLLGEVLRAEAGVRGVATALARYAAYDAHVRDTVGAEPGDSLRRLHAELLARDAPVREGLKYDAAPMVGRDGAVSEIRGLLDASRVVSIVGAGGLGKTRMAHLVGRLAVQPVVHFVELAGVRSPDGVLPEVANALGVRDSVATRAGQRIGQRTTDLRARVAERLAGPSTLLILDNCEHVVAAVADLVAFLVATTDATRVLTTSRAPLGIAAEQVHLLAQLGPDDAAELFVRRARAARSGVRLDAGQVAALVARLDGLPLAIELAAAKVRVMSVAEITGRLGDRFALLVGADRSAPDRHRTLQAVIDWSWNLLRPDDQQALRALAVFPDGFTLDGAEAVLEVDPLAAVAELVDQSLVVVSEGDDGISYRLLETVREYGLDRLVAAGERVRLDGRLRAWARDFSRTASERLYGPDQVAVVTGVRREVGNLAAVMRASIDDADPATLVPVLGLLSGYWSITGDHLTLLGVTSPALDLLLEEPGPARVPGLPGVLTGLLTNEEIFTSSVRPEGLRLLQSVPPEAGSRSAAETTVLLAVHAWPDGSDDPDHRLDALLRLSEDDDPVVARLALIWSGQALENAGDLDGSRVAGERALTLGTDQDGPWLNALIHSQLAGTAVQFGDWDAGRHHARAAIPVMRDLHATEDVLQLRSVLALADLAEGRLDEARSAFESIATDEHSERSIGWNVGIVGSAELALAEGDVDEGLSLYRRAMASDRSLVLENLAVAADLTPWSIYGVSATLYVGSLYGRRDEVADLAEQVRELLPRTFRKEGIIVDHPIAGCAVAALGVHRITGPGLDATGTELALRCFALAHRFGYQRFLPSMAWANLERLAEEHAPGELAAYLEEYAARRTRDLDQEALRVTR